MIIFKNKISKYINFSFNQLFNCSINYISMGRYLYFFSPNKGLAKLKGWVFTNSLHTKGANFICFDKTESLYSRYIETYL
jgi:hypothetical protein